MSQDTWPMISAHRKGFDMDLKPFARLGDINYKSTTTTITADKKTSAIARPIGHCVASFLVLPRSFYIPGRAMFFFMFPRDIICRRRRRVRNVIQIMCIHADGVNIASLNRPAVVRAPIEIVLIATLVLNALVITGTGTIKSAPKHATSGTRRSLVRTRLELIAGCNFLPNLLTHCICHRPTRANVRQ